MRRLVFASILTTLEDAQQKRPVSLRFASPFELCAKYGSGARQSGLCSGKRTERPDFKAKLFAEMDDATPPGSIIASSSSGITMDVIESACKRPERCVIGHPFNPPHVIPLVEVVGGAKTSPETIERAMAFYSSIWKKPIRLFKALLGHVANQLQAALYNEVLYLIQQGVLSDADADVAVSYGPRWRVMGPSLQWHLGGGQGGIHHFMEHIVGPMETWMKALTTPDITPELKQTVAAAVLQIAGNRSVEQLAAEENEVVTGLRNSRAKAGL